MDSNVDLTLIEDILIEILNRLEIIEKSVIQLNGYFYILIFGLAGVGLILLFYKFIKIFI
jgi:hypothetical protein